MNARTHTFAAAVTFALLLMAGAVDAKSHSGSHRSSHSSAHASRSHASSHATHTRHRASGASHHSHGRIKRSAKAKDDFRRSHPCPSTGKKHGACPGYVVDHVRALKHGGADAPYNMQWQTKEAAKAKDKVE